MKIVFDTTVFAQGFPSRSAVRLLKHFLEHGGAELCVPAIVIDEAVNLVRKGLDEANSKLNALRRLTGDDTRYARLELEVALNNYRESISSLLEGLKARILPYPTVSHEELARRALIPNKPFVTGGRGYRDALIWFSVLAVARQSTEEITFISNNTNDWCQNKNELLLHDDLLTDLRSKDIEVTRFQLFRTLDDFIQECAVDQLQVVPSPAGAVPGEAEPDYLQLLVDGKEWIETITPQALAEFLRRYSRADAPVEDVEILGLSAPTEVRPSPVRIIEEDRRLLEFSAKYRIALQFIIRKSDLPIWSQRLTIHLRQDWDENRLRIQSTMGVRFLFRMIERGENTEDFSVVSVFPDYYGAFQGLDPIAVRLRQTEVHAPEHTTWGIVKCNSCGEEFAIGCHRQHPTNNEKEFVAKMERMLAADHRAGRPHENIYDLGSSSV